MNNNLVLDFHRRLQKWYDAHGRKDLPWRNTRDAYAIYVSEIMLQQTQVKTVLERYYAPFLNRFPTIEALAKAPEKDVLKAWQGLGYYNRAVNLHRAAKKIRDWGLGIGDWGKEKKSLMPNAKSLIPDLMSLPGIGQNTAHAVAAFAYHQPVPVLEANVKRVIARIFAIENIPAKGLWNEATTLLNRKNPFDYNQAMMDLGSMICTPRAPNCAECPANQICKGKTQPQLYPARKQKKTVPVRKKNILVLQNEKGEYFAEPRTGKFLNGLYRFVESEAAAPKKARHLGDIRQQYSHFTLEARVYLQIKVGARGDKSWHPLSSLGSLPMSAAEQKIVKLLK